MLEWVQEHVGSEIYQYKMNERSRKQCWQWHAGKRLAAKAILKLLLPHLIVKREQAEVALAFCAIARFSKSRDLRHELYEQIMVLNQGKRVRV